MLVKAQPEQVAQGWDYIKVTISRSLPPIADAESETRMNNVLKSILSGKLEVWLISKKDGEKVKPYGVMTTTPSIDGISGTAGLLIYTLYSIEGLIDQGIITEIVETMIEYGKTKGYDSIMCYSAVDSVVKMAEHFGGNADYRLLIKSLR